MKKLIPFLAILVCLLSAPVWATDYYNCNGTTLSTSHWNTVSANCGTGDAVFGASGFPASGAVLHANSYTIAIDTDPGPNGTVTISTVTGTGSAGGGFTLTLPALYGFPSSTAHMNRTAGSTECLLVSGSTGGDGIIIGNSTGGTSSTATYGTYVSITGHTLTLQGDSRGGTGDNSRGVQLENTAGIVIVTGTCLGGGASWNAYGCTVYAATTGYIQVGNCQGSSASGGAVGCNNSSTAPGGLRVVGNLIFGTVALPTTGYFWYTPAAPTNYALWPKDASYAAGVVDAHATEIPGDPGIANVRSGTNYGTLQGTMAPGGGGGAWAQ